MSFISLGVNVDHIATIRQARLAKSPDPVFAAQLAEQAGADSITMHLREDRRHIQDNDIIRAKDIITTKLNLEIAATDEMLAFALTLKPADVCLVPEKRQELTTEGGLDLFSNEQYLSDTIAQLKAANINVSLFIDSDIDTLNQAKQLGASTIELHTGAYADNTGTAKTQQLARIAQTVQHGLDIGLQVNAGHGLDYHNTNAIAALPGLNELNIGYSIVSHALFVGWTNAVREMKAVIQHAANN